MIFNGNDETLLTIEEARVLYKMLHTQSLPNDGYDEAISGIRKLERIIHPKAQIVGKIKLK